MKKLLFLSALTIFIGCAKAQTACDALNPGDSVKYAQVWNWSIDELKEAAKTSYFAVLDMINDKSPYTKEGFEKALNQFEYWRKVVDLKLVNKKDRDEFHNWLAAEARSAGKVKYDPFKKSE